MLSNASMKTKAPPATMPGNNWGIEILKKFQRRDEPRLADASSNVESIIERRAMATRIANGRQKTVIAIITMVFD